jgi:hypothetical protein
MFRNDSLVLLLSRSHRQSGELFRKVTEFHRRLKEPLLERRNADELLLANRSRVVCLPCKGETTPASTCSYSTRPHASPTTSTATSGPCSPSPQAA